MSAHAILRRDLMGLNLIVSPAPGQVIHWNALGYTLAEGTRPGPEADLRLSEETARAIYEALAEHFGLAGSTALLKAHTEALQIERQRVDKFINHHLDT
ncbi:hypothetical protein [Terracoccus sp. 273MFTsu3.1]|uniref:hypothetical protein n=1 Tax=Terracoccus sp. 273MFTsu3.1 TaxID=1172188 RepID=UPI0003722727|nr:hypothetical protein [Terracoccus sp. 273MFTsu3.1]